MNIAYVGFGKSVNRYHLPYVYQRDNMTVVRVVASHLGKHPIEQQRLEEAGVIFSTNIQDIINDGSIDLVVVSTPSKSHYMITKQLLEGGKNVLVDKPISETLNQVRTLNKIAAEKKLFLMSFQDRRFDSDYLTVSHVVKTGYLGDIFEVEVNMDHYRPTPGQPIETPIEGKLFDHGVHMVDQIINLWGAPQYVGYNVKSTLGGTDDQFTISLYYAELLTVTIRASESIVGQRPKWILHGTKGSFIKYGVDQQENDLKAGLKPGDTHFGEDTPSDYGKIIYFNQNGDRIDKRISTVNGDYGRVYDAAFDAVVSGTPPLVTSDQMESVIAILAGAFNADSPHIISMESVLKNNVSDL